MAEDGEGTFLLNKEGTGSCLQQKVAIAGVSLGRPERGYTQSPAYLRIPLAKVVCVRVCVSGSGFVWR